METLHFKNKEGYRKWLATGHIKGWFVATKGKQTVFLYGMKHKVKHGV
jgi:hypothetical protein